MPTNNLARSFKCLGFIGWMFGHSFQIGGNYYQDGIRYCRRCGMPEGGWK